MPITVSVTTVSRGVTFPIPFTVTTMITRGSSGVVVIPTMVPRATISLPLTVAVSFSVPVTVTVAVAVTVTVVIFVPVPVPVSVSVSIPVPFPVPFPFSFTFAITIPVLFSVSVTRIPVAVFLRLTVTRFFALAAGYRSAILRDLAQTFLRTKINEALW